MNYSMKLLFTFILLFQTLFGWGNTGHRIVGKVAETYLTKNAKVQIKKLMGHHDLSRMSNWADHIKSDPNWKHANDWHWCTIPDGEDYEKGKHRGLAAEKVKEFITVLKKRKSTKEEKQVALKFLIHLIGDLHQQKLLERKVVLKGQMVYGLQQLIFLQEKQHFLKHNNGLLLEIGHRHLMM